MTELPDYETDHPTAYKWTARAFELLTEELLAVTLDLKAGTEIAMASGECPRCGHEVGFAMELHAPLPGPPGALGDGTEHEAGPEHVPVDVVCRCMGEHPGRPDHAHPRGCGVAFRVVVSRTGDAS